MMKSILDTITAHKKKSVKPIVDNQMTYIPTVEPNQVEYMTFDYLEDGMRRIVNQTKQVCFRLRYLKLKPMMPRKALEYACGKWSMTELVDNEVIYPFMMFINGRFIPWNLITISMSQDNNFVIVDASPDWHYLALIRAVQYVQMVSLPSHIRYTSGYHTLDDTIMFSFNEYGMFTPGDTTHVMRSITDANHIIFKFWSSTVGVDAFPVLENSTVKLTEKNIMLFRNGLFATGEYDWVPRAFEKNVMIFKEDEDGEHEPECPVNPNEYTGYVAPCLTFTVPEGEPTPNPKIRFDSSLLTIGDGHPIDPSDTARLDFGVFINTKYTPTVDNISKTDLNGLAPYIKEHNLGNTPEFLPDLQQPFEMAMDRKKYYDENVADAIKTMLSYNASLFNKVIEESSDLIIEEHDGAWLMEALREDGTVAMSRYHNNMVDEYIIVLVNGLLYKYYSMIKYKVNQFLMPVQSIEPDDKVELLRFQNVNNFEGKITVQEDEGFIPRSSDYINENMILFSPELHGDDLPYDFPKNGLQHFPVEYSLEYDEQGNIKIILADHFYYGKELTVVFKNRFRHYRYHMKTPTVPEKFTVDLGNKFMYCHDYTKFLVFYNGRRLSTEQYRLTLPVRPGTPFSKFEIYLTLPVDEGDILDVIYLPNLMTDLYYQPEIPLSGDIVIDKSQLGYGLSTDLYMVWINGKKVPRSCVADIDSTHMRVITDIGSTKNVCVTKYIPDIDCLTEVFKENEALWDKVMSQLTTEEAYKLLGIEGEELTDTEENFFDKSVGVRTIMYELIRDQFVANPRVDTSKPFVYDYLDVDKSAVDGYDSGKNAILPVADASITDNLSDVKREWP